MDLNKSNTTRDGTGLALVATATSSSSGDDRNDKKRKRDTDAAMSKWEGYSQVELAEQLQAVFRQGRDFNEGDMLEFPQEEALSILRACPKLLVSESDMPMPWFYFLKARANLETVQELCQLYNDSGGYKDDKSVFRGWPPVVRNPVISDACRFWNQQDGVIKCLADHFPDKLLGGNGGQISNILTDPFPLRELLQNIHRYETREQKIVVIDSLLVGNPHILDSQHGQAILCEALEGRFGTTVMHCLFSKGFTRFITTEQQSGRFESMDVQEAFALSRALPRLTWLDFRHLEWTRDAYQHMLDSIYHFKPALTNLQVPIFPAFFLENNNLDDFVSLLRLFIKQSKTLRDLTFQNDDKEYDVGDETNHDFLMDFFRSCILGHPTIARFALRKFIFHSAVEFSKLLSNISQKHLALCNIKLVGGWTQSDFLQRCGVHALSITNCQTSSIGFRGFLSQLSDMPNLVTLTFEQDDRGYRRVSEYDVTDVLVQLLNKNIIESVLIDGFFLPLDYQAVFNALVTNTSLKSLILTSIGHGPTDQDGECLANALKHHNSTLTAVETSKRNSNVDHFLRLNRFGRANAQSPDVTKSGIVSLLSAVLDPPMALLFVNDDENPLPEIVQFNIQHGLLAECPGAWSSP